MRFSSEDLRELYQQKTSRRAREAADTCLSESHLTRAAAGELSQTEREQTADHLSTCSDCVQEYRAISSLKSWAEEAAEDADGPSENANARSLRLVPSAVNSKPASSLRWSGYFPYAVAAASVVLSLVLGLLLLSKSRENKRLMAQVDQEQSTRAAETGSLADTRRQLEESTRRVDQESAARRAVEEELAKQKANANNQSNRSSNQVSKADVNVPIFDLVSRSDQRGEPKVEATSIELPPDTELFTLILNLSGKHPGNNYSLEVVDRNNRTIWAAHNLRKSAYDNFSIVMRSRSFPAGQYRLRLYSLDNGRKELIEQYSIRLSYR